MAFEGIMSLWAPRYTTRDISTIPPPRANEDYKYISEENTNAAKCINPAADGRTNYIKWTNDQSAKSKNKKRRRKRRLQ